MTATDSYLLLRAFCDELARCGLTDACTSPGSRSTPIVLSLVRDGRISCWSHVDERCAGFFALGAAKATGRPVAVTCTSGTAAANLAPAVYEAHEARVPLIVLTADRPPELRDVGAGQTIDQLKLYGSAVKWFAELDLADASPARQRWLRGLACRAYWTALDGRPGPVHLNVPLREPLVLSEPLAPADDGRPGGAPWLRRAAAVPAAPARLPHLPTRGIVVAGRHERSPELAGAIVAFAERARYPLLADPLSGARRGRASVDHYDFLLRDAAFSAAHAPDLVIRVGDLPTSKPLRTWLAELPAAEQVALDPESAWQDPAGALSLVLSGDPARTLEALAAEVQPDPEWLAAWRTRDALAAEAIAASLGDGLSEPAVAAALGPWLPPEATLFVASSMPVRDVESFWAARDDGPRVLSNRGANGIDGTVSSAFGAAATGQGPVVLLLGDVALAYDIGGLLAARRLGLAMTIVLLNNDGGGIFHFLPVAGETDGFERHVATPHGLDYAHAAALYGCRHELVPTLGALQTSLVRALRAGTTTILEVRSDRVANLALHRRVADAVQAALTSVTG
jgi:2-succinyl-5-enolpyruvyl-6-hydroxy-3-cyclohexene-1-carboxylate synthase